jgi:opacity protein-like surface antigen
LCLSAPAFAQGDSGWYAGIDLTRFEVRFAPHYTELDDGEESDFDNRADGLQADLALGHRRRLNDRVSLALQGAVGFNDVAWTLSLDEPADFRYSIPYTISGSLLPEVRLAGPVWAFAEVGGGVGRVKQEKSGSTLSTYDSNRLRGALALGGGVFYQVGRRLDLVGRYRYVRYAGYEFDSIGPGGQPVEHVAESPRTVGVSVGIRIGF